MPPRDITSSRHRGNRASADAFENSQAGHVRDREVIFGLIERSPEGLTSADLEKILGKPKNCFSGRLTELKRMNRIRICAGRRDGCQIHVKVPNPQQLMLPEVA